MPALSSLSQPGYLFNLHNCKPMCTGRWEDIPLTSPLYREKPLLAASVFSVVKGRAQSPAGSYQDSQTVLADQGLRIGLGLVVSWLPQNTSAYGFTVLLRAITGRECLVSTGHQEGPCDLKLHPSMGHSFSHVFQPSANSHQTTALCLALLCMLRTGQKPGPYGVGLISPSLWFLLCEMRIILASLIGCQESMKQV